MTSAKITTDASTGNFLKFEPHQERMRITDEGVLLIRNEHGEMEPMDELLRRRALEEVSKAAKERMPPRMIFRY